MKYKGFLAALVLALSLCVQQIALSQSNCNYFLFNSSKFIAASGSSDSYYDLVKTNKPFIVMFYTDWCGACKRLAPYFSSTKEATKNEITLIKVNAETEPSLSKKFAVKYYPTIVIYNPKTDKAAEIPQEAIMDANIFNSTLHKTLSLINTPSDTKKSTGVILLTSNLEQSINNLNNSIKANPKNSFLYYMLGDVYMRKKDYDKALTNLNKALSLSPNDEATITALMNLYMLKDQYDKTIEFAKKFLAKNPSQPAIYSIIGNCLNKKKQYDKATEIFNKCLEISPNDKSCYMGLALSYAANKQIDEAIEATNNWKRKDYNNTQVYTTLGSLYLLNKNDAVSAKDALFKAISLDDKNSDAYAMLAGVYFKNGNIPKTLENLKEAFKLDPQNPIALSFLGGVYLLKGQTKEAKENFDKARESNSPLIQNFDDIFTLITSKTRPLPESTDSVLPATPSDVKPVEPDTDVKPEKQKLLPDNTPSEKS